MNTSEQKVSSVEINCKCEAQAKTAILNFLDKLGIKKGNYILIYTNYVKTLHYICILCKKLLY